MNLESTRENKTAKISSDFLMDDDFDFKPITSGLGFHHKEASEVKPAFTPKVMKPAVVNPVAQKKNEMNLYQNDLSLFYGQTSSQTPAQHQDLRKEKTVQTASMPQRFFAYVADLLFIVSLLGIVLTIMARTISMDLMVVWQEYPHEITPLVVTLFCGFYLIYFSIFEKSPQSTLGKDIFKLQVVTIENKPLTISMLLLRSFIGLLNFLSLGLFSYFDLQNRTTNSKVIRND